MSSKKPPYLPSLGRLLGFASAAVNKVASKRLKSHGLTVQQWVVLTALWRAPRLSESELADYCQTSQSAMNKLVDRMQAKRLVRRTRDPADARRAIIELAAKGRSNKELLRFYRDLNRELLKGFAPVESKALFSYLERVVENAEAALR
jgi:DNA-binding MarR family transcriptional regulator